MRTKEWLIKNRTKYVLTQRQLAAKIGVSAYTIENIEQGKRLGSVETWNKIENFFKNSELEKENTSYDSTDLIEELTSDIEEFGDDHTCILIYKIVNDCIVFTNYDFIVEEDKFDAKKELDENEKYIVTTLKYALDVFKNQNKLFH